MGLIYRGEYANPQMVELELEQLDARVQAGSSNVADNYNYNVTIENYLNSDKVEAFGVRNVKTYGALGDGLTDDTAAIQQAIDETGYDELGGIVYFPPGRYLVSGTGDHIFTINHWCSIIGAGQRASWIIVDPTVGATTNLFGVVGGDVPAYGEIRWLRMAHMAIGALSGTPGKHAIFVDSTSGVVANAVFEHLTFSGMGAEGFACTGGATDGYFFNFAIQHCFFIDCGIKLDAAGDAILIHDNLINGGDAGIDVEQVPGSSTLTISQNNIVSGGPAIRLRRSGRAAIIHNMCEEPSTGSNYPAQPMIHLKGTLEGGVVTDNYAYSCYAPWVEGNTLSTWSADNTTAIKLENCRDANIGPNAYYVKGASCICVQTTANTVNPRIDIDGASLPGVGTEIDDVSGEAMCRVYQAAAQRGTPLATFDFGGSLSAFIEDTDWVDLPDSHQITIAAGITAATLEAMVVAEADSPQTECYVRLYNITDAAALTGSTASQGALTTTKQHVASASTFALSAGLYKVQIKGTQGASNRVAAKVRVY